MATLLYSTSGLFLPLFGYLVFRQTLRIKTLIAIAISFIGVVVTLGTVQHIFTPLALIGLLSGAGNAGSQLVLHTSVQKITRQTANWCMYGFSSLLVFIILPFALNKPELTNFFQQIDRHLLLIIIAFSMFSIANQHFRASAYKKINKAASLTPVLYSSIVFSSLIDWVWFGIVPSVYNLIGISLVISGAILLSLRFGHPRNNAR